MKSPVNSTRLENEDCMEIEDQAKDVESETASRPATSIISDFSVTRDEEDRESNCEGERDASGWKPASTLPPNKPLRASYKYVSPRPTAKGPYVVGVDEAGRGPALGPMVYGMAFCSEEFVNELGGIGFDGMR